MEKFVRVNENGVVVECVDVMPENAQGDWRPAVNVVPTLIPFKQIMGTHTFDITKDPVEIVWSSIDLTLQERKDTITGVVITPIQNQIREELNRQLDSEESVDLQVVQQLMETIRVKKLEIDALQTHQEVDDYIVANGIT